MLIPSLLGLEHVQHVDRANIDGMRITILIEAFMSC